MQELSTNNNVAPWPVVARPTPKVVTLDEALMRWEAAKRALENAKEAELEARKLSFDLGFGKEAKEGVNKKALGNGYELKGTKKLNYRLKAPENYTGDVVDAVDDVTDKFTRISNEGSFIADRLFTWKVDLSLTEYRKLEEEAAWSKPKADMLKELNKILVISEATPTLEIKAPKNKGK